MPWAEILSINIKENKMETNDKIEIKLQPEIAKAIQEMGYTEFTDIQQKSIPLIQEGRDVIGQSFTGSGKTAAFGLPILEKVNRGHGLSARVDGLNGRVRDPVQHRDGGA